MIYDVLSEQAQLPKQLARMRSVFCRARNNSLSRSLDEYSLQNQRALAEHKLKILESNFNQIALAYHTEAATLQSCIAMYREKFTRADTHAELLFEAINKSLNGLANFLHSKEEIIRPIEPPTKVSRQTSLRTNHSIDSATSEDDQPITKHRISHKSRKFIHERIVTLHKEVSLLKVKLADLLNTSSMVAGLKQVWKLLN